MTVDIAADCGSVRVGQRLHLRFMASGSLKVPTISSFELDGETTRAGPACAAPDPHEQPRPGVVVQDVEHVYRAAGRDRITVSAATFCSRFPGTGEATITIEVRP